MVNEKSFTDTPIKSLEEPIHCQKHKELDQTRGLPALTLDVLDELNSSNHTPNNTLMFSDPTISFEEANFDFTVDVVDTFGSTPQVVLDLFKNLSELALGTWAKYVNGADGARLDVQVNVGGTEAVASAGPGGLFFTDFIDLNGSGIFDANDIGLVTASSLLELQTGVDPNGDEPDIIINVNPQFIDDGRFFFDPELDNQVPPDRFDFYSVILHEVAHGLGFFGLARDLPVAENLPVGDFLGFGNITAATLYDLLIDDSGEVPVFGGPNSVDLYGSGVPLEFTTGNPGSDLSHFLGNTANDLGVPVDLRYALMNPFVIPGDRVGIGALELALLEDIGHEIVNKSDVPFINTLDPLPDSAVPTVTLGGLSDFDCQNQNLSPAINLSSIVPLITVASSVGIEIATSAGATRSERLLFEPGSFGSEISLSLEELFGQTDVAPGESVSASVKVRLFNPPQAVLEGVEIGSVSETFTSGSGNDELVGGAGNDILRGGDGNDEFIFEVGNGNDIVVDFNFNEDNLYLDAFDESPSPTVTQTDEVTLITFTETDSILLEEVFEFPYDFNLERF